MHEDAKREKTEEEERQTNWYVDEDKELLELPLSEEDSSEMK